VSLSLYWLPAGRIKKAGSVSKDPALPFSRLCGAQVGLHRCPILRTSGSIVSSFVGPPNLKEFRKAFSTYLLASFLSKNLDHLKP